MSIDESPTRTEAWLDSSLQSLLETLSVKWQRCNNDTKEAIHFMLRGAHVLTQKEQGYGEASKEGFRVFSKSSANERIRSRIDDKLNRISNTGVLQTDDEDTLMDLMNYCALLAAVERPKK